MKAKAWLIRHRLFAAAIGILILGILTGNLLSSIILPSRILGVPSVLWAAPGSCVVLPEGNFVNYLSLRESRSHKSPPDIHRAIDYAKPESYYDFSYDDSIWLQENTPVLCRVRILGARDYFVSDPSQFRSHSMEQSGSIIFAHVQEVLFDERDNPMQEGTVISFVWRFGYAQDGRSSVGVAFYPDTQWYLTLHPSGQAQEHIHIPENLRADERFFVQTHADYVLQQMDIRTRGYWPIWEDRVYTLQRLLEGKLSANDNHLWGYPGADYPADLFPQALRQKFDEIRSEHQALGLS